MRLLLDTHVFLWCVKADRQLGKSARETIVSATEVYVGSASIWETTIKKTLGKRDVDINALVRSTGAVAHLGSEGYAFAIG